MHDVAQAAGVAVSTVSYVLTERPDVTISPATRERVLRAAQQLNYCYNAHAADLRRGATRMVGVQVYSLGVPILARKVTALERGLRQAGYYPFLCHATDREAERVFLKECLSRRVCGIVLTCPVGKESRRYLRQLMARGAVVVSSEPIPHSAVPYVTVDRRGGAEMAVRHLLALGHRRIALLNGFTEQAARDFAEGYQEGLTSAGVDFDPALVLPLDNSEPYFYEIGERAVEQLWSLPTPPTALLATDDEVALGALRALQRRGLRVPEDVAVIGCDDLPVAAYASVPLTTLAQPAEAVGARLAQMLIDGLNDPARIVGCQVSLPLRLVIRESCGAKRSLPH